MDVENAVKKISFGPAFHSISPTQTVQVALSKLRKLKSFQKSALENVTPVNNCGVYTHRIQEKPVRYNAWGKGLTEIGSQASALMEYVERFSAENPVFDKTNTPILSSRRDLKGRSFFLDSLSAYNFQHNLYDDLTFYKNVPILWSKVWSITRSDFVYIPTSRIYPNYPQHHIKDFCCTNGFSANNTITEAIVQGLCEVIERHTLHLHWLNDEAPKLLRISKQEISDPVLNNSLNLLNEQGYYIVMNLHETGLPFFTTSVFMINPDGSYIYSSDRSYIHFATATSLNASLSRCISECLQTMAFEQSMLEARESENTRPPNSIFDDLRCRLIADCYEPAESAVFGTFDEEIDAAVNTLSEAGVEVLVADCTHPILNIPVVRVICPGLQPNFILRNKSIGSPYAIVSKHIDGYKKIWQQAQSARYSGF